MGRDIGQAHVPTAKQWAALEAHANATHKLIWALTRYTGARIGAVLQLRVGDIYKDGRKRIPLEWVTYRKETVKGRIKTLVIPVNTQLKQYLKDYIPSANPDAFLFPGKYAGHLSYEAAEDYLARCKKKAKLDHLPIRTHSGRRWCLTMLAANGVSLPVIQTVSGHESIENLRRYIEVSPNQVINALEGIL